MVSGSTPVGETPNAGDWATPIIENFASNSQAPFHDASFMASEPVATLEHSPEVNASSHTPGLTTRPDLDEIQPRRAVTNYIPYPRRLGIVSLSVDKIERLFQT